MPTKRRGLNAGTHLEVRYDVTSILIVGESLVFRFFEIFYFSHWVQNLRLKGGCVSDSKWWNYCKLIAIMGLVNA